MEHPNPNPPESAAVGHELRDPAVRPILIFVLSLVATLVIVHFVAWGVCAFCNTVKIWRLESPSRPIRWLVSCAPPPRTRAWNPSRPTMSFRKPICLKSRIESEH